MLQKTGSDKGTETNENLETHLTARGSVRPARTPGRPTGVAGGLPGNMAWSGVQKRTLDPGDKEKETWAGSSPWTLSAEGSSLPHDAQPRGRAHNVLTCCPGINTSACIYILK